MEELTLTEEHLQKVTGGDVSNGAAGGLAAFGFAGGVISGAALTAAALLSRKSGTAGAAAHAAPAVTHSMPEPRPTPTIQRTSSVGPKYGPDGKKTVQWADQVAGSSGA
jgi:hypothetical protein